MRKLIATVSNYSLDCLLADEGTEFWRFCFSLPENREPDDPAQLDFLQRANAHLMGHTAYEAIAASMTKVLPTRPGLQHRLQQRDRRAAVPAARACLTLIGSIRDRSPARPIRLG